MIILVVQATSFMESDGCEFSKFKLSEDQYDAYKQFLNDDEYTVEAEAYARALYPDPVGPPTHIATVQSYYGSYVSHNFELDELK